MTLSWAGQSSKQRRHHEGQERLLAEVGSYPRPDILELCPHVGLQVMMILVIPDNPHQIFITSFRPLILTPMDIQPQSQSTDIELHKEKNFSDHKRILLWTSFFADPSFSLRKDIWNNPIFSEKFCFLIVSLRQLLGERWSSDEDFSRLGCPEFRCLVKSHL